MRIHTRSEIQDRVKAATPKFANPTADAQFDEHARQDILLLLEANKKLEKELALAKMGAMSRAGRVPR